MRCCSPRPLLSRAVVARYPPEMASHWETLLDFNVLDMRVTKYRSNKTGLTLCLAAVEGPLVNGFLTLGE